MPHRHDGIVIRTMCFAEDVLICPPWGMWIEIEDQNLGQFYC